MEIGLSLLADKMNFTFSAWLMTLPKALLLPLTSTFAVLTMWSAMTAVTKEPPRVSSNSESLTFSWPMERPSALSLMLHAMVSRRLWQAAALRQGKEPPGELDEGGDGGGGAHVVKQNDFARVEFLDFVVGTPFQSRCSVRCNLKDSVSKKERRWLRRRGEEHEGKEVDAGNVGGCGTRVIGQALERRNRY